MSSLYNVLVQCELQLLLLCCAVCSHNTEKVVYFLLLDRKLRNPCKDDDEDIKAKSECGSSLYL